MPGGMQGDLGEISGWGKMWAVPSIAGRQRGRGAQTGCPGGMPGLRGEWSQGMHGGLAEGMQGQCGESLCGVQGVPAEQI